MFGTVFSSQFICPKKPKKIYKKGLAPLWATCVSYAEAVPPARGTVLPPAWCARCDGRSEPTALIL